VVVAGASGFVGRRLCPALAVAGHEVIAMTRRPDAYQGVGTPIHGDVHDAPSLRPSLAGGQAAQALLAGQHPLGLGLQTLLVPLGQGLQVPDDRVVERGGQRNIVRDQHDICALCDADLPHDWNFP
jgi:NAD(P)-dependent dehydrogenase (short-subunit alcohol dehydrogenase family)